MKIKIKVKANAKKSFIEKITDNDWIVSTTKEPINNKANLDVIKIIAKDLGVSKSRLAIISGASSKEKVVEISD